jgi:hypothetical protein
MSDHQQPILASHTHRDELYFLQRVSRVWNGDAEVVSEYRRRFFKGHTMCLKVSCSLVWIPLKIDAHSATVPSNCKVIIPWNGWRVNYERMYLVEKEKGSSLRTGDDLCWPKMHIRSKTRRSGRITPSRD